MARKRIKQTFYFLMILVFVYLFLPYVKRFGYNNDGNVNQIHLFVFRNALGVCSLIFTFRKKLSCNYKSMGV